MYFIMHWNIYFKYHNHIYITISQYFKPTYHHFKKIIMIVNSEVTCKDNYNVMHINAYISGENNNNNYHYYITIIIIIIIIYVIGFIFVIYNLF